MVVQAGSSSCSLLAQALALELNAISVVHEAVEDRVGECRIADDLIPAVDRDLAGDDQ